MCLSQHLLTKFFEKSYSGVRSDSKQLLLIRFYRISLKKRGFFTRERDAKKFVLDICGSTSNLDY